MKTLLTFALTLFASVALAQSPTGLTPADSGTWYDPAYDGAGFEIHVIPTDDGQQIFAEFFARPIPGWYRHAVWFTIQGTPDDTGTLPLLLLQSPEGVYWWSYSPWQPFSQPTYSEVGSVTFDMQEDGRLEAEVTIWSNGYPLFSPTPPVFEVDLLLIKLL